MNNLWRDWCTATGHDPSDLSPTALDRFTAQVPAARPPEPPRPRPDPWEHPERSWAPLADSLTRCPVYGWPAAVPGRRDAWLLIATRHLRLQRRDAVGLRAHDLPPLLERLAPAVRPGPCPGCVLARWLEVVETQANWSRASVRVQVWRRPAHRWAPAASGSALPCDSTCSRLADLVTGLPGHTFIAPAVDRHGWWTDWRPLSTRALTAILASRCDPRASIHAPVEPSCVAEPVAVYDDSTFDRLDAAMAAADEVNERLAAILAEYSV